MNYMYDIKPWFKSYFYCCNFTAFLFYLYFIPTGGRGKGQKNVVLGRIKWGKTPSFIVLL